MVWEARGIFTPTRTGRHVANRGKRGGDIHYYWPATQGGASLGQGSCRPSGTSICDCSLLRARDGVGNRKTRSDDHVDERCCRGAGIADCNLDLSGLD